LDLAYNQILATMMAKKEVELDQKIERSKKLTWSQLQYVGLLYIQGDPRGHIIIPPFVIRELINDNELIDALFRSILSQLMHTGKTGYREKVKWDYFEHFLLSHEQIVECGKQMLGIQFERKSCRDYFGKRAKIYPQEMEDESWTFPTKVITYEPKSFPEKFDPNENESSFSEFLKGKVLIVPTESTNRHIEWAAVWKKTTKDKKDELILYGAQVKALKRIPSYAELAKSREKLEISVKDQKWYKEKIHKTVEVFYFINEIGDKKETIAKLIFPTVILTHDAIKDMIQPSFHNLFDFICGIPQNEEK